MSDERLLAKPYEVDGIEYELWCDRYGYWTLVFGGVEQDNTQFTEDQLNQIAWDVAEFRAP